MISDVPGIVLPKQVRVVGGVVERDPSDCGFIHKSQGHFVSHDDTDVLLRGNGESWAGEDRS